MKIKQLKNLNSSQGSVELNLNSMPDMAKTSDKCTLDQLPQFNKTGKKVF